MSIDLDAQINCVRREIGMRERVYPAWTRQGKLKPEKADYELAAMRAVMATLENVKAGTVYTSQAATPS